LAGNQLTVTKFEVCFRWDFCCSTVGMKS